MNDTIFALATAQGRAAVAVMRVSGPGAEDVLKAMGGGVPEPRLAVLRRLRDPTSAETIDQALVLWMPGPRSFTGEDVVELHLHGGRAVIAAMVRSLTGLGLRPAEAGEFTRRAFEHGRLDLSEAEAVADLVDAETDAQRRQALDQLGGSLARRADEWRGQLVEALAGLEAAIDFPDEDLPETILASAAEPLRQLRTDLLSIANDTRGDRVRDGFHVALIGAPNAGKSSLLNLLTGRDAAIVTSTAGTTRDVIEVVMDIAGYRVVVADTAGIREAQDEIEREGVRRAYLRAEDADLRLWVVDRNQNIEAWKKAAATVRIGDILVRTKTDLQPGADEIAALQFAQTKGLDEIGVSALGSPDELRTLLTLKIARCMSGSEAPLISRERHRMSISAALVHLDRALEGRDPELVAEDVRLAARAIERISGRVDSEAVLDRVFASFCIGK